MVRLVNRTGWGDDGRPRSRPTDTLRLEDKLMKRFGGPSDPFEGRGAQRRMLRLRVEGLLALGMAIVACALTAALWIRTLAPLAGLFGQH